MLIKKTIQKVVVTKNDNIINAYLNDNWKVVNVASQHVASSGLNLYGDFCFVIEKEIDVDIK